VINNNGEDVDSDWVANSNHRMARDMEKQTLAKAKLQDKGQQDPPVLPEVQFESARRSPVFHAAPASSATAPAGSFASTQLPGLRTAPPKVPAGAPNFQQRDMVCPNSPLSLCSWMTASTVTLWFVYPAAIAKIELEAVLVRSRRITHHPHLLLPVTLCIPPHSLACKLLTLTLVNPSARES
jgi:hypothetical protein